MCIRDSQEHGLIAAGAAIGRIGIRRGKHRHVLPGTAHFGTQLIALMHPGFRQAICYWVILTNSDLEGRAQPMTACPAGSVIGNLLAVLVIPERPRFLRTVPPAADADHFIERDPIRKRIVGRVNADETAAALYILLEL